MSNPVRLRQFAAAVAIRNRLRLQLRENLTRLDVADFDSLARAAGLAERRVDMLRSSEVAS